MSLGENTLQPLQIEDAREAAHRASERQRNTADERAAAIKAKALAEFRYRRALTERIKQLHTQGFDGSSGLAITMCETVAKGEEPIALLRRERDEAEAEVVRLEQEGFRLAANRRSLDGMLTWSMHRDLRTDTPPADWQPGGSGLRAA